MKNTCACLLLLTSITALAERIDGPANIRESPKGKIEFSLNDGVEVETSFVHDGWYEIAVTIELTKEQYDLPGTVLKQGTKLYDMRGKEIGVALADVLVGGKMTGGGAPGIAKWYAVELRGYTFKSNIRPESIVEPVISKLIESNKTDLSFNAFEEHMKEFNYVDGLPITDMPQYVTYMVHESSLDDVSPLDRIRLIFQGQKLVAIVHSRDLQITGYETVLIERERKLTLLASFSDEEKAKFIAKNNESYAGVD